MYTQKVGEKYQGEEMSFTRAKKDVNGNSRWIVHFLNIARDYETALKLAKQIGGKKYHNKSYGGGIVFQSVDLGRLERHILNISETR